jgi:hypothetical protein
MAKRHKPTNGDGWDLTPQQAAAVDLLATGRTVTEAAEQVGVVRQTVSEWLNQHYGFRVELNKRRQELWAGASDRLRALLPKALDTVEGALEGKDPLPAALAVLKATGLHGLGAPSGATNAEDLEVEEQERAGTRRERAMFAVLRGG